MESMIYRVQGKILEDTLRKNISFFLFGPRQSGKTTLIKMLLNKIPHIHYNLMKAKDYLKLAGNPTILREEVTASKEKLVFIDEIQKLPELLDEIQTLIDEEKKVFIITGSSARKLKRKGVNLLPGRTLSFKLLPLSIEETRNFLPDFSRITLKRILRFGELPKIFTLVFNNEEETALDLLYSYTETYLNEEIKAEAIIRRISSFSRFLKVAAEISGRPVSFRELSQDIGISHVTVSEYFKILEDTLVATSIPNCSSFSERSKGVRASKYLFFDTGIINTLSGLVEIQEYPEEKWGLLFEQWTGLTILKTLFNHNIKGELCYWREGKKEIDWIIKKGEKLLPIEVKWGETIRKQALNNLVYFIEKNRLEKGIIVYTGERKRKISEEILAVPWYHLPETILEFLS